MVVCHCLPQGKQCTAVTHGTASDEAVAHCGGFPRPVNNPGLLTLRYLMSYTDAQFAWFSLVFT